MNADDACHAAASLCLRVFVVIFSNVPLPVSAENQTLCMEGRR
jgi:hypothetical protein